MGGGGGGGGDLVEEKKSPPSDIVFLEFAIIKCSWKKRNKTVVARALSYLLLPWRVFE